MTTANEALCKLPIVVEHTPPTYKPKLYDVKYQQERDNLTTQNEKSTNL